MTGVLACSQEVSAFLHTQSTTCKVPTCQHETASLLAAALSRYLPPHRRRTPSLAVKPPNYSNMSLMSQLDLVRSAIEKEQHSHDSLLQAERAKTEQLQAQLNAKNAELASINAAYDRAKRSLDHLGDSADEDTVKKAKTALDVFDELGGIDAIKALVAEKAAADKAAAEAAARAAAQAAADQASRAAAEEARRAQERANAQRVASREAAKVSAPEAQRLYDEAIASSGFAAGQVCCAAWSRNMCSLVKIVGWPNPKAPTQVHFQIVVRFGQPAYVSLPPPEARRCLVMLTRDNIVSVQNRVFDPKNIKKLYEVDSDTLHKNNCYVPDLPSYTNSVRSQTRAEIVNIPELRDIVGTGNGKRPAALASGYKDLSDAQINAVARRESMAMAVATAPGGANPAAAALMAIHDSAATADPNPSSGEGSSSSDPVLPPPPVKDEEPVAYQDMEDGVEDEEEEECVIVNERTVEQRNEEGYANAIILD